MTKLEMIHIKQIIATSAILSSMASIFFSMKSGVFLDFYLYEPIFRKGKIFEISLYIWLLFSSTINGLIPLLIICSGITTVVKSRYNLFILIFLLLLSAFVLYLMVGFSRGGWDS